MREVTNLLKNYIQAILRYTEKRYIQCYICRAYGYFSSTCKNKKKIARNTAGPWRGENRDFKLHSQSLNQISNRPSKEKEETNDHQRLNYISDESSDANCMTNYRDYCFMMRENKQSTYEIS